MKLCRLLEIHELHRAPLSLDDNLGDGALYQTNSIYRHIRDASVKAGYKFSSDKNNFYDALPLSQLDQILTKKIIPYTDNVSVLRNIEKSQPRITEWPDLQFHLKRNFIFHESCHAVARSCRPEAFPVGAAYQVLQMLFEESYANACELLAVTEVDDKVAQQIFYEMTT